jgi:hypothetical protein
MIPKLVVAEPRSEFRPIWRRLCAELNVEVLDIDIRGLLDTELDAVVVPGWVAHERVGGKPELGRSQVLSNSAGLVGKARWVVTTPPFASDVEQAETHGVPKWPEQPEQQGFETFSRVLAAVEEHNSTSADRIETVGFEPEFLNFSDAYDQEASGVIRAVRLHAEASRLAK